MARPAPVDVWFKTKRFNYEVIARAKFAGDLAALAMGQSFSTFVERAVLARAACVDLLTGREYDSPAELAKAGGASWESLYDEAPGVAWCKVFALGKIALGDDTSEIARFVLAHKSFFYDRHGSKLTPNRRRIETLWDHILEFADDWDKYRHADPWKTGEKMAKMLKDKRVPAPEWGPGVDE